MRLRFDRLTTELKKGLAPIYVVSGDEPLQVGEAVDAIRRAVKAQDYAHREVFYAEKGFSWAELSQTAESLSLFSERRLLELRLLSGKPGNDGAKVLVQYANAPPDDTILLIISCKLTAASFKLKWLQALDKAGVVVQIWPLEGMNLVQWLEQRVKSTGLQVDREGIHILASRVEGNLLAAAQEIDKLYALYGKGKVGTETISNVVVDDSRFDVFKLVDSLLQGNALRVGKILAELRAENISPAIVLWALTREIRLLNHVMREKDTGGSLAAIFKKYHVWEKRQSLLHHALRRLNRNDIYDALRLSATADKIIKGEEKGESWNALLKVSMSLAAKTQLESIMH